MGQVPGEVVSAAFGVFNPAVVVPMVSFGGGLTDAATICEERTAGATAQLARALGSRPDGLGRASELLARAVEPLRPEDRPLYAGLAARGLPGEPLADTWRKADMLREYRGDSHISSWTSAGFDATEIGLLSELWWGMPMRTYIRTRAWSDEDLDAAEARLVDRGLVADGQITPAGHNAREGVERATDRQCRPIVEALGDDIDELLEILRPWGKAIRDAGGYPAGGMHDLARVAARS